MTASNFEASFRSLAETAADAIIIFDERSTIVFVNGAVERIFRYTWAELLGKPMTMLMPDFVGKVHEAGPQCDRGHEQHIHWRGTELPGLRKDGSEIALEISFGKFSQDGRLFFTGIARDITQRKRDLRLKTVYLAAAQALGENRPSDRVMAEMVQGICQALAWKVGILWQVDPETRVLRYAGGWSVAGKFANVIERSRNLQISRMAGLSGRVWHNKEPESISRTDKDPDFGVRGFGEAGLLSGSAFPVIVQDHVVAVMEFFTTDAEPPDHAMIDIFRTIGQQVGQYIERRQAEQALAKSEAELRRLVKSEQDARLQAESGNLAKDEFLAIVSHELRTPLTSVFGWVQLLRAGTPDPAIATKGLDVIERNVRAQIRIVDDLLNVSEILTGKIRIQRELLNPAEPVSAAIETVRPSADAKQIQIFMETDSPISRVAADPQRLHQLVWNLLLNAVKFTPRGGSIRVQIKQAPGELRIVVSDNGLGISAEFLPYVFQRFSQADTTSTRKYGGLGIGLAVVRQLVELHGGRVIAESEGKGFGSRFTVSLPLPAAVTKLPARPARRERSARTLKGIQVLLVEDDADTREMVSTALEGFGASVVQASSGAEALKELESSTPSLLICDIGMPEMNGYEMMALMRQRKTRLPPAMALTAFVSQGEKERALRAGFQAYLAKPVALHLLFSVAAGLAARAA